MLIKLLHNMDFEQTQSIEIDNALPLEYEQCQHCSRSFFKGKLKYHLKLCNSENPMIISPKKTSRQISGNFLINEKSSINSKDEKKCEKCNCKLPGFLFEKHIEHCLAKQGNDTPSLEKQTMLNKKSSTDVNFKQKEDCSLPVIKHSARHRVTRQIIMKQPYQVKLREELSCFRRAQQIKQVQCPFCERKFSNQASLRHVPICQALRKNDKLSIALKQRSKANKSLGENLLGHGHVTKRDVIQKAEIKGRQTVVQVNPERQQSQI